jgi:hypothetical protein
LCICPFFWTENRTSTRGALHSRIKKSCSEPDTGGCNLSYSGGKDQDHHGSKPAHTNSSRDPISKKPITQKKAGKVAQGVGSEFKPQHKKKKRKEKKKKKEKTLLWTVSLPSWAF